MFWLTGPVLAEETMTLMVTWTDWWITGRYLVEGGDDVKAAMGLMAYTMWVIPSLFAAIAIGATAIIARRVGGREFQQARVVANQSILVGGAVAIVITAAAFFFGSWFIHIMQLRGGAAVYAQEYLSIVTLVIPLIMVEQVGAACLRGAGDTITGFVAKAIVVVINIILSYTLATGAFGFEPMGFKGIAIGTAVGHGVGGTILLIVLLRGRMGLGLSLSLLRPQWDVMGRLLKIGFPGGLDIATILVSNLLFVGIINSLGTAAAAAHGLAVQLEACAYLPANAFYVAAATLTGQYLGAGMPDRAVRAALACIGSSVIVISITGVMLYFGGNEFVTFFTNQPEHPTTLKVVELLRIVAFALPALAVLMVTTGALRGAGDTVWPLVVTLVGFFVFRIPLGVFFAMDVIHIPWTSWEFSGMGWGVSGAWYGMAIDLFVRSFIVTFRFWHGSWKTKSV